MVAGFTRHHEKDIGHVISHKYREESKLTIKLIEYDANLFFIYSSCDIMLCGKDALLLNEEPFHQTEIKNFRRKF